MFDLLVRKMFDRITSDRRADTLAMANAVGMAFGGKQAYDAWMAGQQEAGPTDKEAAIARQRGAIGRLQRLLMAQPNKAFHNVIRHKPDA